MHKKLFIPGPVDVCEDVLEKLASPQIGHRTKEAGELQRNIVRKLQKIYQTENVVLLSSSSGTGLMEGAVRSCIKTRAAIFSCGAFGEKFYKICQSNGKEADMYEVPKGQPITKDFIEEALEKNEYDLITVQHNETSTGLTNPIREIGMFLKEKYPDIIYVVDAVSSFAGVGIMVDDWGIDVCISSTQKCLGLPAGFSLASVSEKAIERAKTVENRGTYFDFVSLYNKFIKDGQYPSTPSLPHMFALDYQLDKILEEGLETRYKRHEDMAILVRDFGKKYFDLFVKEDQYLSNTVTCIENTREIDIKKLNQDLGERGYIISNGYGDLKDKTFRIAHMADYTVEDVEGLLNCMVDVLGF